MNRRDFVKFCGCSAAALTVGACHSQQNSQPVIQKPLNILILTADDMAFNSVGAFGCKTLQTTPNLDRLASQGMRFTHAHVNIAVCQPSRSVIVSGLYPHRSGSMGFEPVRDDVPVLPETFSQAGYLTGCFGKVGHSTGRGKRVCDYEYDFRDLYNGRDPKKYCAYCKDFFGQAKKDHKPFFLQVNSHDPHRPYHASKQEQQSEGFAEYLKNPIQPSKVFKPEEVDIPHFLPDLPDIRREIAQYYSSVRRCDDTLGMALQALDEAGLADQTLVLFLSDNGISMPFSKTNCYLNSTKTPLIIRWPGIVKNNTVNTDNMISAIDFAPTLLEACGLPVYPNIDGRSFLPCLLGKKLKTENLIFTEFHRTSANKAYPMRCVQDKEYGYIVNFWADGKTVFKNEGQTGLTWKAMVNTAKNNPKIAERVNFYEYRCREEFYDLRNDPDCLNNLIDNPQYTQAIKTKKTQLESRIKQTQDIVSLS